MEALRASLPLLAGRGCTSRSRWSPSCSIPLISLVGPVLVGYSIDTLFSTGRLLGRSPGLGHPADLVCNLVLRELRPDQDDGRRRAAAAVQSAEYDLHEAAGAARRVLQPEQGGGPDFQDQQRHRQAESVLLSVPDAVHRQPLHDGRRGDLPPQHQFPPGSGEPGAGSGRAALHTGGVGVDSPQERPEPSEPGRPERARSRRA